MHHDHVYFLTRTGKVRFPITPPPLQNHGNYIISLNRFVKWLGGLVEAEGIDVFTGFPAVEVLYDGDRVVGVRTGDRGIGKHGERKSTFEPGVDIRAKVTILDRRRARQPDEGARAPARRSTRDGCRSSTRSASRSCGRCPPDRLPPAPSSTRWAIRCGWKSSAAAFIYAMPDGVLVGRLRRAGSTIAIRCSIRTSRFQHFKRHPFVAVAARRAAQMVRYGAKALPEGGWHTIPRVYAGGVLIAGDAGGFLNSMRLKGIHLAMRTGMLAAESGVRRRSRRRHVRRRA